MILTERDRLTVDQMIDHHREALKYIDHSEMKRNMSGSMRENLHFHQDSLIVLQKLKQQP